MHYAYCTNTRPWWAVKRKKGKNYVFPGPLCQLTGVNHPNREQPDHNQHSAVGAVMAVVKPSEILKRESHEILGPAEDRIAGPSRTRRIGVRHLRCELRRSAVIARRRGGTAWRKQRNERAGPINDERGEDVDNSLASAT